MPDESVDGTDGLSDSGLPGPGSKRTVTPAVAAALVVLAAAFIVSVAFILANGGLDLPAAAPLPSSSSGLATGRPAPTGTGPAGPSPAATASTSEPVSPGPVAIATPTTAAPGPAATPGPAPGWASAPIPRPSSDRYDLLTACPDVPDCWIYVIRRGDNLVSIANYFGVSLQAVEKRNPWTLTTGLVAGRNLLLPTPQR